MEESRAPTGAFKPLENRSFAWRTAAPKRSRSALPTYARTVPPSAPRIRTNPSSGNPSYHGSRATSAVQSNFTPSSSNSVSSSPDKSYQSLTASNAVPRWSAALAVDSASRRSKPTPSSPCGGAMTFAPRRKQRSLLIATANQVSTASFAAASKGRLRPTRIEAESSTIAASVSATSSSTTRVCKSPARAVAAQSMRRTSSPGTYSRSSTNS